MNFLGRVRKICLALPEAHEKVAWGAPTFRVRNKQFAMFLNNHHGDSRIALWCKAPPGAQEILVKADPEHFFVPPYVGPSGWLGIHLNRGLDWGVVAGLVRDGYIEVAPKRLLPMLEATGIRSAAAPKAGASRSKRRKTPSGPGGPRLVPDASEA